MARKKETRKKKPHCPRMQNTTVRRWDMPRELQAAYHNDPAVREVLDRCADKGTYAAALEELVKMLLKGRDHA